MIKKSLMSMATATALAVVLSAGYEVSFLGQAAYAQQNEEGQSSRRAVRVQSIRQKHIKTFEKLAEDFEAENFAAAEASLNKLSAEPDLNNIELAYIANYRGNIAFSRDDLNTAVREFKKILERPDGIPLGFYNQMYYVVAQVYFSQENYTGALDYAQRWFKTQEEPPADAYMLIGQALYMLQRFDDALPNVTTGIEKYEALGSIPKEGWLNLLSSIYRQKEQYQNMIPVLKKLITHYPKKTYMLALGGVFNELEDQPKMTAIYQAMHDQGMLNVESEIVTLASLLLSQDSPYKASQVLGKGFEDDILKKNLKNYRLYSQALYIAREYEDALAPLERAAGLADDGKLYVQLGQSLMALNRWADAEKAIQQGIRKGKLSDIGRTLVNLGSVQFELKKYDAAVKTFESAQKYDKARKDAGTWIKYVTSEVARLEELAKPIVISGQVDV